MLCNQCGAALEENALVCGSCGQAVQPENEAAETATIAEEVAPVAEETVVAAPAVQAPVQPNKKDKPYPPRRKPHILLRLLLQLLSLAVCLVMCISLVATVVLADLNQIMSAGGIQQLVNAILLPNSAPHRNTPVVGAYGVYWEDAQVPEGSTAAGSAEEDFTFPGDLDIDDIPEDILGGGDSDKNISALVDWIYEEVLGASEGEEKITKEQLQTFVEESTVSEFMADKLAGFAEDFINGTANTTITTEEVLQLLEENMPIIEKTFDVKLTLIEKELLTSSVEQIMEQTDINEVIREQVFSSVEDSINDSVSDTGLTWEQLQPMLQVLCADTTTYAAIGVCVGLMLLLCLLNFYNVPAGLTWSAFPCILIGAVLTVPLKALPFLSEFMPEEFSGMVTQILNSFIGILLPIHSAVLYIGFGLLVISILWRIIRACIRRKRRLAAAAA